jgi:hypothetical protein
MMMLMMMLLLLLARVSGEIMMSSRSSWEKTRSSSSYDGINSAGEERTWC